VARGLNKVMLIGNLGRDPELRKVGDTEVANFSLACTKTWKDRDGEQQERTEWARCFAWGKVGSIIAEHASKGDKLYIEGEMETRQYEQDDVTKRVTEVRVREFMFLGGAAQGEARASAPPPPDDDLPF